MKVLERAVRRVLSNSKAGYEAWLEAAAKGEAPGTVAAQYDTEDYYRPNGYCDHPGRGF